jgi:hypothetical protein
MASYDSSKEKIISKKEVSLSTGTIAVIKYYSYDGGTKRVKMNFVSKKRDNSEFITNKFPGIEDKEDVLAMSKALKAIASEME